MMASERMRLATTPDRFQASSLGFLPAYRRLSAGELRRRAEEALDLLRECRACPRECGVDRLEDRWAVCKTGRFAIVNSFSPHLGEEDCLRGWRGSGTIFFSMCNLKCVFCQNYAISHLGEGQPVPPHALAAMMLHLQDAGCHNINLVTPEHVAPQILEALPVAVEAGLNLPIVYNTSAYDAMDCLRLLDGIVDMYMPDFKCWDREVARRYLLAPDYPEAARASIAEMHRQSGDLVFDERGLALRGLLVRHLVMPEGLAGTAEVMRWLAASVSPDTYVNLMDQYAPAGKVGAGRFPELNRRITRDEYRDAVAAARGAGLWRFDQRSRRGWI